MLLAEIIGPDILIILAVVALLFGGSQLPKLARSLGSAKAEFEKGVSDAGFTLAGLALPVGAVVGAIVSAAGAPERVGRRRLIAAVVLGGLVLAFWAAMFLA